MFRSHMKKAPYSPGPALLASSAAEVKNPVSLLIELCHRWGKALILSNICQYSPPLTLVIFISSMRLSRLGRMVGWGMVGWGEDDGGKPSSPSHPQVPHPPLTGFSSYYITHPYSTTHTIFSSYVQQHFLTFEHYQRALEGSSLYRSHGHMQVSLPPPPPSPFSIWRKLLLHFTFKTIWIRY